ncbi:MAG: hypothetical protein K9J21_04555 [Bacteroidales bacterium]|nr:hypothetical protein [Bacteroidales bacterium]
MRLINVFAMISILICSLGVEANAQNPLVKQPDSIKQKVLLLEKEIFEAKDLHHKNKLIIKKAYVLKDAGSVNAAIKTFDRVPYTIAKEELAFEALYNLALLYYSQNKYEPASQYLSYIDFYIPEYTNQPKVIFLNVLVHNVLEEFKGAKNSLEHYSKYCDKNINVDSIYKTLTTMKQPEKAKRLSGYMPGLGQFYAGKPWKGINSFLLNAGFLGYAGYCVYHKRYVTSVFSGLEFFVSFYTGGKRNAYSIVQKQNARTIQNLNHFLIEWSESCNEEKLK